MSSMLLFLNPSRLGEQVVASRVFNLGHSGRVNSKTTYDETKTDCTNKQYASISEPDQPRRAIGVSMSIKSRTFRASKQ